MNRPGKNSWQGRIDANEGPNALRWHQVVRPLMETSAPGFVLIGFACDEGVRRNGGRIGAAGGPMAIRRALGNLAWHGNCPIYDAGDIECTDGDLEEAQKRLGQQVALVRFGGHLPLVLGGGHETAYGTFLGIANSGGNANLGIVNFDAHFDLRPFPPATSGTPFAQIAKSQAAANHPFRYACMGIAEHSNTHALFDVAESHGVIWQTDRMMTAADRGILLDWIQTFLDSVERIYLTIDLDILPASSMPAVSAPAARGVSLEMLETCVSAVLASEKVVAVDLVEFNPTLDPTGNAARLAALVAWQVVRDWRHVPPSRCA